jgi:Methylamine utilisation protein MauE
VAESIKFNNQRHGTGFSFNINQGAGRFAGYVQKIAIAMMVALFAFSSVDKMFHYDGFLNALRDYSLIPLGAAKYFGLPIIIAEAMISIGLIEKQWRRFSSLAAAGMLGLFSVALSINSLYGKRGICGCWFTITLAQGTTLHILQNVFLICLLVSIWWNEKAQQI